MWEECRAYNNPSEYSELYSKLEEEGLNSWKMLNAELITRILNVQFLKRKLSNKLSHGNSAKYIPKVSCFRKWVNTFISRQYSMRKKLLLRVQKACRKKGQTSCYAHSTLRCAPCRRDRLTWSALLCTHQNFYNKTTFAAYCNIHEAICKTQWRCISYIVLYKASKLSLHFTKQWLWVCVHFGLHSERNITLMCNPGHLLTGRKHSPCIS